MDTELLVDTRIDDGRRLIAELVRDGFDVTVAFWVKTAEEGLWFLYVGSTAVDTNEIGNAYRRAYNCLMRIPSAAVALSEIKLVDVANPIARDAIAIRDRYAGRIPARYQGKRLGNVSIEEAYIYPRTGAPMTRNEVVQTVLALMNRTGALQPSVVALRNGSTINAIPVGVNLSPSGSSQLTLRDINTGVDREVAVDDVLNIQ